MLRRSIPFVFLILLFAAPIARADPMLPGEWQVGGGLYGALGRDSKLFYVDAFGGYVVRHELVVGLDAAYALAGAGFWRAGGYAEFFLGPDVIRPFAQLRLEAMGTGLNLTAGIGFTFGVAWQPLPQLLICPNFGFDSTFKLYGLSFGEFGLSARFLY